MAKPKATTDQLPLSVLAIQCISEFPAPKTTQDALDVAAAELMVAGLLRSASEKRYEAAKKTVVDAYDIEIAKLRNDAAENMVKSTKTIIGVDWTLTLNVNKPSIRVDADDLRTALVKQGVKAELIDKAMKSVEKKSTPALIITPTWE
jgi:hypothetical protein